MTNLNRDVSEAGFEQRFGALLRDARPPVPSPRMPSRDAWGRIRARIEQPARRAVWTRWFMTPALTTACATLAAIWVYQTSRTEDSDRRIRYHADSSLHLDAAKRVSTARQSSGGTGSHMGKQSASSEFLSARIDPDIRLARARMAFDEPRKQRRSSRVQELTDSPTFVRTVTCTSGYVREVIEENGRQTVVTRTTRKLSQPLMSAVYAAPRRPSETDQDDGRNELPEPSLLERATVIPSGNTLRQQTVVSFAGQPAPVSQNEKEDTS